MKFFLNNEHINPIDGLKIGLRNDFKQRNSPEELMISNETLILPRRGAEIVKEWRDQFGLGNGIPAHVQTKDGTIIKYYVDLWDPSTKPIFKSIDIDGYKGVTVQVKLKRRDGNFFEQAKSWSFEMLADAGVVFDTIDVDYIIVKDNQVELGLSLALGIYNVAREVINQSIALTETIRDIIKATTANVDPLENVEDIISLTVRAISQIVVLGLLLFALIKLSQRFFELIFPNIRQFKACTVREVMEKSAAKFGFTFKSTLLDSLPGTAILPLPLQKEKTSIWEKIQNDLNFSFTKGYPTASDAAIAMVPDYFREMEKVFAGATKVQNNCVEFEVWNYWQNITQNQIELNINLDDENLYQWSYNTEEVPKRRVVKYQTDNSDSHTKDFFDPTISERSVENTVVPNADLETISGFDNINLSFALGVRKGDLNWLESLAKEFFGNIDNIINLTGGSSSLESIIDNRKGVLQISEQFYSVPKLMYLGSDGRQPTDYVDKIGAIALNNNFYSTMNPSNIAGRIFENVPIRISQNDYVNLLDNNFINNGAAEIYDIQFFDEKEIETETTVTVKIFDDWSNGKQIVKEIG